MPLRLDIENSVQREQRLHEAGPLEFGRGSQQGVGRCQIVGDLTVSRDQLRIEERPGGRVRLENLSRHTTIVVPGRCQIAALHSQELDLPLRLTMGATRLSIELDSRGEMGAAVELPNAASAPAPGLPAGQHRPCPTGARSAPDVRTPPPGLVSIPPALQDTCLKTLSPHRGSSSSGTAAEQIGCWLQTIIELQETGAESPEFYGKTARALVDLVDMDLGLVLFERGGSWSIAGSAGVAERTAVCYSQTLLNYVVAERRTFYEDLDQLVRTASMVGLDSAVASPIFGVRKEVVGVLYGVRTVGGVAGRGDVGPLEAQLVQLLAAAVGANLARATAERTRVQFEQFFSSDLVRELEHNANLLEGRIEEVTVLFSDLRGFTALSERLGAHKTCRMLRDMMERFSRWIVEHRGVIVDYAGDGILAMWNAPAKQPDHAERACRAALAMLGELPALNARWGHEAAGSLALGIGINTGEALVGNTGSERKFKYGPHGHSVNLASRIQDATKKLGLPLLITAATRERLPATLLTRRIGRVLLPGIRNPVVAYELCGEPASPEWIHRRDSYETALTLFEERAWPEACRALMPLLAAERRQTAPDTPTLKLMRRVQECLESHPDPFDPIIEVSMK